MKKILLGALLFLLTASFGFAQKNKVQSAFNYYKEPYKQFDKAVEAIDAAILDEQTGTWAKTWYYKGLIYSALFESEEYGKLCNNCLLTAYEAFEKSLELDPKNEWVDEINAIRIPYISYHTFNNGIKYFREQNFKDALTAFELVQKTSPEDTSAILNSAYSADQAGLKDKAIIYYQKLVDMHYKDNNVFLSYTTLLNHDNKMEKALQIVREGRKIFPDSLNLMLSEINILLSTEKNVEASQLLDAAISKDPGNPNLYLVLGSTYSHLGDPKDDTGKELVKPANSKELLTKAEQAYIKGIEISPDNYEINFYLGALYFNLGAELANSANNIKDDKLYEQEKKNYEDRFRQAQPHLEKAMEFNPKSSQDDMNLFENTITSLKEVYVRLKELEKYEKIKDLNQK